MRTRFLPLLLMSAALASPARAERAVPLPEPRADYALRLELIRGARESIDLAIYHQGADEEVGRPILEALRDAARRGVKIRFVGSYMAAQHSHAHRMIPYLLNDDSLPVRPRAILFGQFPGSRLHNRQAMVWTTFDEKYMVVDHRVAVIGGRGVGADYLGWRDLSVYVDGVETAARLTEAFEKIWAISLRLYGERARDPKPGRLRPAWPATSALLEKWRPAARAILTGESSIAAETRVLHHDGIRQFLEATGPLPSPRPDPILERFLELTRTAGRIRFTTLYPILEPRTVQALCEARRRGADVAMLTNSRDSTKAMMPIPVAYAASLHAQLALARCGVGIRQWVPSAEWGLLHSKFAVFDDVTLMGSHNFNWSSTNVYDELDVELRSPEFADAARANWEAWAGAQGRPIGYGELRAQARKHRIEILLSWLLYGLY